MSQSPSDLILSSRSYMFYLAGGHDPSVIATYAPKGSLFLRVGTLGGFIYQKQDDGLTTNWTLNSSLSGLDFQGGWDANLNVPDLTTIPLIDANKGKFWIVTTTGTTNLGGIADWEVGDWAVCTGTFGTGWMQVDNQIYANQTLSNLLSPTAINQNLIPNAGGTINLGSLSTDFWNLYTRNVVRSGGNLQLQTIGSGDIVLAAASNKIDASNSFVSNVLDPLLPQDAATKNYVDLSTQSAMNPFFGGYVNDDGPLKTNIAAKKVAAATAIENTGSTVALQALINAAIGGDVIEIQHNGPYGFITIPSGVSFTLRAGVGFLPVFTAQNAIRLLNGVTDVYLIGLKFLNCTTADSNGKGSAICFNTNGYKADGLTVSNCYFEKNTSSSVLLAYHMSIGGDNYVNPYLPAEMSTNVNFVDCNFLRAATDATEGAALMLRGVDGATIRRCYSDAGNGTDPWAGEGRTRSYMLQYCTNSIVEDCIGKKLPIGADEVFKFDQLSAGLSSFKNTVTVRRCYAEGGVEGFDNDDQGDVDFNQNAAYLCTRGIAMTKATGEGSILSSIIAKCTYGVYIAAPVPTGTLDIRYNDVFLSTTSDYELLNGYVLNTNNLEGSRPTLLSLFLNADSTEAKKETFTYDGVTPTYTYDLMYLAKTDSVRLTVSSGLTANEGVGLDYTTSVVGGKTRITLLVNLYSVLVNGDQLYVQYLRA